ncbi:hypothetical protein [Antarcticibacterium sp. 1MA-6-2]|nr:hypothetical protein [Antarcticibacterium sp. 1MA-6-2]
MTHKILTVLAIFIFSFAFTTTDSSTFTPSKKALTSVPALLRILP